MDIDISNYLRLNLVDVVLVCISTLILCLVAKHFFWDYILDYFENRHQAIAQDIRAGEVARQEGETYKAQYVEQISGVKAHAHDIIETAQKHANEEKKEIITVARKEAENIKSKARNDMEREKIQAEKAMKKAISEVAFEAAKQIVKKEIDEEQQRDYIDDFIEHAGDQTWQA